MKCIITLLPFLIVTNICLATLSPPSDKKSHKGVKPQEGSRKNNVLDRKLVVETPYAKDILKYHATYHQDTSHRNFKNTVLGYVTPMAPGDPYEREQKRLLELFNEVETPESSEDPYADDGEYGSDKDYYPIDDVYRRSVTQQHCTYNRIDTTPIGNWNSKGYDVAKIWAPKFNYISPVWLQIKRQSPHIYLISGLHDVDHAWMKTVKQKGSTSDLKLVPRLLFENWEPSDLKAFFMEPTSITEQKALIGEVKKVCRQWKFDGVVLEILSQIGKYIDKSVKFIQQFGLEMTENNLSLILVYPPFRGYPSDEFFIQAFNEIYPYVNAVSVMTYDFSSPQKPGPNAPLYWIKLCLDKLIGDEENPSKRSKILIGLNFYGNSYTANGGGPIVGTEYIELLKNAKANQALSYNNNTAENYIEVRTSQGAKKVFFPTLFSIQKRLDLAREYGAGVAIWELGQGLQYFYDLL